MCNAVQLLACVCRLSNASPTATLLLYPAVGVDRQGLAAFLVDQAQQQFPHAIAYHWHARPTAFDFKSKTVTCGHTDGLAISSTVDGSSGSSGDLPAELSYDLLVGADGAASNVRAALVDAVPGMKVSMLAACLNGLV